MIVRTLQDVKTVEWGNGLSRRFLLESDNVGYSLTDTVVRAGTSSSLQYRAHVESCYCIAGRGEVVEADGTRHALEPGTMYSLNENDAHFLVASPGEDLRLVCVFSPPLTGDESHQIGAPEFSAY